MADGSANPELPGALQGADLLPSRESDVVASSPATASVEPIIVFDDVSISFGDHEVLRDVSFFVERGQTLCILGRSGVGKSVSLRILMGFLKPDSGSVRVEGREITALDEDGMQEIRKRITMVFQNGALFDSLSVRENVAFPLRERGSLDEDQIQRRPSDPHGLGRRRGGVAACGTLDGAPPRSGHGAGSGVAARGGAL
jgi:ABC-type multidrug transport system fused ATPase/permease subunit